MSSSGRGIRPMSTLTRTDRPVGRRYRGCRLPESRAGETSVGHVAWQQDGAAVRSKRSERAASHPTVLLDRVPLGGVLSTCRCACFTRCLATLAMLMLVGVLGTFDRASFA